METVQIILVMLVISNAMARDNSTYNAVDLVSKILFPQELHSRTKYTGQDISQDISRDVYQDSVYRNNVHRKKRRRPVQRYPDGQTYGNYPQPGYAGNFYERPSFATEALSRVTEALTSIALYDDLQCVPRLLCEAGGQALNAPAVPTGLQPLLTLLSAYGGVSSNPLFVFGRAVLLGMSSKENPGSCRYAYPRCPTDPEQLIHYLNNHNGGFFRFFSSPQNGQQNLQQFYNHLQYDPYQQSGQHINGLYQQQQGHQQNYGLYQQQNNGLQPNDVGYGLQNPNPYLNYQPNYGFAHPYNNFGKIEKRIQNKPLANDNDDFVANNFDVKWSFPEGAVNEELYTDGIKDTRNSKSLRFPDYGLNSLHSYTNYDSQENYRESRGFVFPNNRAYYTDDYRDKNRVTGSFVKENNFNNNNNKGENDGFVTVYVVRGDGDPNRPEMIKLRPGQSL